MQKINSFFPEPTTHMGTGPCPGHPRVLQAMARPTVSHLCQDFLDLCQAVQGQLQYLFQTKNNFTIPFQGSCAPKVEVPIIALIISIPTQSIVLAYTVCSIVEK